MIIGGWLRNDDRWLIYLHHIVISVTNLSLNYNNPYFELHYAGFVIVLSVKHSDKEHFL